jgi:hypothetical protein
MKKFNHKKIKFLENLQDSRDVPLKVVKAASKFSDSAKVVCKIDLQKTCGKNLRPKRFKEKA